MVLSDVDILKFLEAGELVVDPIDNLDEQLQPCSIDLRLGYNFRILNSSNNLGTLDIKRRNVEEFFFNKTIEDDQPFILHPQAFVLGRTIEYVKIPSNILAQVDGRSSIGRIGVLVHATAGFIDPGFEGTITLELKNLTSVPVALYPGMRVCQISFTLLSTPAKRPYGVERGSKYQKQIDATVSRLGLDKS